MWKVACHSESNIEQAFPTPRLINERVMLTWAQNIDPITTRPHQVPAWHRSTDTGQLSHSTNIPLLLSASYTVGKDCWDLIPALTSVVRPVVNTKLSSTLNWNGQINSIFLLYFITKSHLENKAYLHCCFLLCLLTHFFKYFYQTLFRHLGKKEPDKCILRDA